MNIKNLVTFALMLTLMSLSNACTSLASSSLIPIESRAYDLAEDCTGFVWQYNKCVKKILGICFKSEIEALKIEAEFKDKAICKTLYDMNFILKVREKPF